MGLVIEGRNIIVPKEKWIQFECVMYKCESRFFHKALEKKRQTTRATN
jgi:hypothetical protein